MQSSLDGYQWSTLITMNRDPVDVPIPYRSWFPAQEARYVRFIGSHHDRGEAVVSTFELYGPDCPLERTSSPAVTDRVP